MIKRERGGERGEWEGEEREEESVRERTEADRQTDRQKDGNIHWTFRPQWLYQQSEAEDFADEGREGLIPVFPSM